MLPSRPSVRTLALSVPATNKVLWKSCITPSLGPRRQSGNSISHLFASHTADLLYVIMHVMAKGMLLLFWQVFYSEWCLKRDILFYLRSYFCTEQMSDRALKHPPTLITLCRNRKHYVTNQIWIWLHGCKKLCFKCGRFTHIQPTTHTLTSIKSTKFQTECHQSSIWTNLVSMIFDGLISFVLR